MLASEPGLCLVLCREDCCSVQQARCAWTATLEALREVVWGLPSEDEVTAHALSALTQAIWPGRSGNTLAVFWWNDHKDRTLAEVHAALDRAGVLALEVQS